MLGYINWYWCREIKVWLEMKLLSNWQNWDPKFAYRTWTSVRHLSRSRQESCHGLDRDHKKHWESSTGLKQAKGLIQGPSDRRTKKLLQLNRNQLWWVVGLLTRHWHLKGHLFKMGLTEFYLQMELRKDESATHTHILCECDAAAYLRFHHLGHYFMGPENCWKIKTKEYA
jgi:hypothetical protein